MRNDDRNGIAFESLHEGIRVQRSLESNARLIENRINYLKREEQKMLTNLENVKRQAQKIEDGRIRQIEKKKSDEIIHRNRISEQEKNKMLVHRIKSTEFNNKNARLDILREKQLCCLRVRSETMQIERERERERRRAIEEKEERAARIYQNRDGSKFFKEEKEKKIFFDVQEEKKEKKKNLEKQVSIAKEKIPQLEKKELYYLAKIQRTRQDTERLLGEMRERLPLEGSDGRSNWKNRELLEKSFRSDRKFTASIGGGGRSSSSLMQSHSTVAEVEDGWFQPEKEEERRGERVNGREWGEDPVCSFEA